jgi:hypothetical protein
MRLAPSSALAPPPSSRPPLATSCAASTVWITLVMFPAVGVGRAALAPAAADGDQARLRQQHARIDRPGFLLQRLDELLIHSPPLPPQMQARRRPPCLSAPPRLCVKPAFIRRGTTEVKARRTFSGRISRDVVPLALRRYH